MRNLVIIGAGGHGRVIADIAAACGEYSEICFLDDSPNASNCAVKIAGKVSDYRSYIENSDFVVAIGNNSTRERIQKELIESGAALASLVHPSSVIGSGVDMGRGSVVMAGAVINSNAKIGDGVIINTCSSVDHDCVVGNYAHISVGAHLAGAVVVGERTMIGAGATVINNTSICDDCIIGAGGVVIRDILTCGTYVGVPVRMLD